MTDPNVEKKDIVRSAVDAYNRGDVATLAGFLHDDFEMVPAAVFTAPGTVYRGAEGVESLSADIAARYRSLQAELRELREVGDWVLALVTVTFAGAGEAAVQTYEFAWIYLVEDGRVRRAHGFRSEAEALEAAERPRPEEFEAAFMHAPKAIVLVDDEGALRDANAAAAEFLGETGDALRGRRLVEFVPEASVELFDRLWERFLADGDLASELPLADRTGSPRPVELRGRANYLPGRHLVVFSPRGGERIRARGERTLTPREREVFQLLALGFSGREIASRLVLSPDTVRTHVQNGIGRLGAKTRAQAIAIALTRGEISL